MCDHVCNAVDACDAEMSDGARNKSYLATVATSNCLNHPKIYFDDVFAETTQMSQRE